MVAGMLDIWEVLARAARQAGSRTAVRRGRSTLDYADLARRASSLVRFVRSAGLEPGDRVAALMPNCPEMLLAYFACAGSRTVIVPLNIRLAAPELGDVLTRSRARLLLVHDGCARLVDEALEHAGGVEQVVWAGRAEACTGRSARLDEAAAPGPLLSPGAVNPDAPAQLYYTSGTTGRPKGVVLTHRNVCVHARAAVEELELGPADVWAHVAPMFHLADAWATFAVTMVGGTHVTMERFDAASALELISRERVTITNLIPTMLNLMVKSERAAHHDYSSLRLMLSGGSPVSPDLVRRVMDVLGCEYVQTYGMTETSPYLTVSILEPWMRRLPADEQIRYRAMTGRPFGPVRLAVVDEHGRAVAEDGEQVGEILAAGPTVTPGYFEDPEETRRAFSDGWLRTGDLAVVDPSGFIDIVDRKKDMIITGGENVYTVEVENALYDHPGVLEAAVVGVPDETYGETVRAVVVPAPGAALTASAIVEHCRRSLAGYKCPRSVRFVDALPRTGSGKIDKKELRSAPGRV
jgi:acyl-CoA synthetase (AMP-forming)/AMP-acid ligase II